ncbi:MAG: TIM barrel protein [Cytophagales bacterium]|nr:TIM barrel protein [Bernardetiaceae bacterium]MDW8209520.1 TIM barrel protein [Cytophagales bacterium]
MKRRDFVIKTAVASSGLSTLAKVALGEQRRQRFNLNYAPHFGMFEHHAGKNLIDQLKFMYDEGFTALEDNELMQRPASDQTKIGETLAKLGMQMGVFVIDGGDNWKPSLTTGKVEFRDNFLKTCQAAVAAAKRVNAKWMTVIPGYYERRLPLGIQTANVIDALRRAVDILEPHGLVMVIEPLSDTPDLFLRTSDQAYMICKAVNSPSCKILYDIYHMQRNEGQLIANMDLCWDEIAYLQIGDNPGRKEPTTGEINYQNVFRYIYNKGYKGILGMEHGNSKPGKEGERALIEAYRKVDNFIY